MVIAAHAGDAENMAAALVLKHTRAGHRASVVHLTLGEAGHPALAPVVYAEQRRIEVAESARLMGAELVVLPHRDGELLPTEEVKRAAKAEGADPEWIRRMLATGRAVIPCNPIHSPEPCAIGEGLTVKINANVGTSRDLPELEPELEKLACTPPCG